MQSNYNLNIQQIHIFNPNEICLKCICFSGKYQFHFQFKKYILNVSMNVNNLPDVQKHNAARSSCPYLFGCVFYRQWCTDLSRNSAKFLIFTVYQFDVTEKEYILRRENSAKIYRVIEKMISPRKVHYHLFLFNFVSLLNG